MTTPRKPGGQPGNRNALKHGIYSQFISLADDTVMQGMSNDNASDELSLARVYLAYALNERNHASDEKSKLAWDFASAYWFDKVVNTKFRNIERHQVSLEVWDTLIEAIRAANDRQDVRR